MEILTVTNQKGGVGKTTVSVHLAFALADLGYRVLFIDLDGQGNSSSTLQQYKVDLNSAQLFDSGSHQVEALEGITLLAANSKLVDIDRLDAKQMIGQFKTSIDNIKKQETFDYCVVDTPPALGNRLISALICSKFVLTPIQLEQYAIDGLGQMLKVITSIKQKYNEELVYLGMLTNLFNPRSPAQKKAFIQLAEKHGRFIIKAKIGIRTSISEALADGIPVWELKKSSAREAAAEMKIAFNIIFKKMGIVEEETRA